MQSPGCRFNIKLQTKVLEDSTIAEKAFFWLRFKTLLRHYAKQQPKNTVSILEIGAPHKLSEKASYLTLSAPAEPIPCHQFSSQLSPAIIYTLYTSKPTQPTTKELAFLARIWWR